MTEIPDTSQFILPDVLRPGLKLVFCGTAASAISAREKAYYANPGNFFWRTLYQVGLTDEQLPAARFCDLLQYNIGLTDMAKQATGQDKDLKPDDFDRNKFEQKILRFQPQVVAFTSKKAAAVYLQRPTAKISYGLQSERIEQSSLWVLPSPSGAARAYWNIQHWQALADYVQILS